MYSILLVDDEELICKGLKSMLERIGHEEIGEIFLAFDVPKALETMKKHKPDIVITDIRMPVLTGLDLIKQASEFASESKFIVLSGYDDFQYVKDAFKLGVADYLLKPASMDDLKTVLEKVMASMKEEHLEKLNMQSRNNKYTQALLENNLNKVFSSSNAHASGVRELFDELGIAFQHARFSICIISFDYNSPESIKNEKIQHYLGITGKNFKYSSEMDILSFFNYNNELVLLFNHSDNICYEKFVEYVRKFVDAVGSNMGIKYFAAISETCNNINDAIICYEHAKKALAYKIIYGPLEIIRYDSLKYKTDKMHDLERQLIKLKEYISNHQSVEISNLVDEMFSRDKLKDFKIETIYRLYRSILRVVGDIASESSLSFRDSGYTEFYSFKHLNDLRIYLKEIIFCTISMLKEKSKERSVVDIVKNYVQENYYKDIDMSMIANMVSMSYSYFSKLFKDETQMNYSDYVIKVRMEKALELLNNPVNRIQDIASNVGYENPKHFTRAFKNYFGVSPKEYRDSL